MSKLRVLLDVDGVLRNWGKAACAIAKTYDIPEEYLDDNPKKYYWFKNMPEKHLAVFKHCCFEKSFGTMVLQRTAEVYPNANKLYRFLKSNFEVVICTNQPNKFTEILTKDWLSNNINDFDSEIIFTDKKHFVSGEILIDDNPDFIIESNAEGKITYCVKRNWNSEIKKRHTTSEIIKIMEEKYLVCK